MIREQLTPITTEMIRYAGTKDRSIETNKNLLGLLADILGKGSLRFCRTMRNGGVLSEATAQEIDMSVLASIQHRYGLPDLSHAQEFYLQQQKPAIEVVGYYGDLLPEVAEDVELKDEVALLSERPSDLIRLLFRKPESIDPTLAYEIHRHTLLSIIAGQINARTRSERLRTVLADAHHLLNEQLFEGPEGAGQRIFSRSFHNDETNTVVGFPDRGDQKPSTAHCKYIPFIVRSIPGMGLVYTSSRKKNDGVAIIKCIAKAKTNGGVININYVQDGIGMIVASIDDKVTPEQLAKRVVRVLESGSRKVIKVEEDDDIGKDHGQSNERSFNARRKIWFEGASTPIELIFYDRETYLNSRFEVGIGNDETGLYMGRSHKLLELRRARLAAPVLFPESIYPKLDIFFANRSRMVAHELREDLCAE